MYKRKTSSFSRLLTRTFAVMSIILIFLTLNRCIAHTPYDIEVKAVLYKLDDTTTPSQIVQYKTKLRTDRKFYDFGEPVRLSFEITNVFTQTVMLRSTSPITPVVDLMLQRITPTGGGDFYIWSKAHPDQTRQTVVLNPGESYTLEWEITPDHPGVYMARAFFVEPLPPSASPPSDQISRSSAGLHCIFYGVRKEDPTAQALCSPSNVGQHLSYPPGTDPNTTPGKGP